LKGKSLKVDKGKFVISDLKFEKKPKLMASYKDEKYRQKIAARYGIYLSLNEKRFQTPYLVGTIRPSRKTLFDEYREDLQCH
jgi:hypothetical protein